MRRTAYDAYPRPRKPPSPAWRAFLANHAKELVSLDFFTVWNDESRILRSRLDTLLRNARSGFLLVLLVLALFLRLRLAFWVSLGVPLSFLGALWLLPGLDISINVISLFAFILVLGILVDDAIVVGENVYTHRGRTRDRLRASIEGAQEVAVPVIFGVLTTIVAFAPMLVLPGPMGQVMSVIGTVVIACLVFSVIESQLVLPTHLAHSREETEQLPGRGARSFWKHFQGRFASGLERFVQGTYRRGLGRALEWRYVTACIATALLLLTTGLLVSGRMRFSFFPAVEADNVVAMLTMPEGTRVDQAAEAVRHLEAAARELKAQIDAATQEGAPSAVQHILASVGEQPYRARQERTPANAGASGATGSHLGEVNVALIPSEEAERVSTKEFARRWRELAGPIPGAVELVFSSSLFSAGEAINIELQGDRVADLREAAGRLKRRLAEYPGVLDIADSFRAGQQEMKLSIQPSAEPLGLTLSDLSRQVRQAFYGEEAQRVQRGRDDIRVMVRYPADERRSLRDLDDMRVRTPSGEAVPFRTVARAELGRGFATIRRADRQRTINVTADVDLARANANEIIADLRSSALPEILRDTPGMSHSLEGEQRETLATLGRFYLIALFGIYALLAIPLRSYGQPLIIMSVIPFGLIGAIGGHLIMGHQLSIMSLIGVVALSGVVVNWSLVLVDHVNRRRAGGASLVESVQDAALARFRPILLTSLTTFAGRCAPGAASPRPRAPRQAGRRPPPTEETLPHARLCYLSARASRSCWRRFPARDRRGRPHPRGAAVRGQETAVRVRGPVRTSGNRNADRHPCLLVENHLISGDLLFVGACGRIDLPGAEPKKMITSLKRVASLPDDTIAYPWHHYGSAITSTIGDEKRTNPYLRMDDIDFA